METLSRFFLSEKALSRTCHVCGCMIEVNAMLVVRGSRSRQAGSHFMGMVQVQVQVQVQGPDLLVPVIRITGPIVASITSKPYPHRISEKREKKGEAKSTFPNPCGLTKGEGGRESKWCQVAANAM